DIIEARRGLLSFSFVGAAKPVGGARPCARQCRQDMELAEVRLGEAWVVKESQGVPTGVEFRRHAVAFTLRTGSRDDTIREVRRAAVEKHTGEILALFPPDVAVAREIHIGLRAEQKACRLDRLTGL